MRFFGTLENVRDLGGAVTSSGKTLKKGLLYRGVALNSRDSIELEKKLNIKTVIDLRTKKESEEKKDELIDEIKYFHMPVFYEETTGISREKGAFSVNTLKNMPSMEELYQLTVTGENLDRVVQIMRYIFLENQDYPLYFHCSAGKDRTGIIAALIYSYFGVNRSYIYEDYMKTNLPNHLKRCKFAYHFIKITLFSKTLAEKARSHLLAKEEYLKSAFDCLEKKFGSMENFYKEKFAFTQDEINLINERFLDN